MLIQSGSTGFCGKYGFVETGEWVDRFTKELSPPRSPPQSYSTQKDFHLMQTSLDNRESLLLPRIDFDCVASNDSKLFVESVAKPRPLDLFTFLELVFHLFVVKFVVNGRRIWIRSFALPLTNFLFHSICKFKKNLSLREDGSFLSS